MLSNTCKYAVRALIYLGKYSADGTKIGIKKISNNEQKSNKSGKNTSKSG